MIILSLTNCPSSLRGELTRWLFEVDVNLYVGKQSARVREMIWERVIAHTKSGRAVMVYPMNNEQGFDFRVWGDTWTPTDYDGLKLMMRPHSGILQSEAREIPPGGSRVEKRFAAKRFARSSRTALVLPDDYLVVDLETTGFSANTDEILEVGAIRVISRERVAVFEALVSTSTVVPLKIEQLTGITNQIVSSEGRDLYGVISDFKDFAGELPIVSHNNAFDMGFVRNAYRQCGYPMPINPCLDTLRLSRMLVDGVADYKLESLAEHFGFKQDLFHRSLADCEATRLLFEQLRLVLLKKTT